MFDGLIEILMDWLGTAWCWILTQMIGLASGFMRIVAELFPGYDVPDWFFGFSWDPLVLTLISLFLPVEPFTWAFLIIISFELMLSIMLPLYRAVMDLL